MASRGGKRNIQGGGSGVGLRSRGVSWFEASFLVGKVGCCGR
jgi:hypothetical protein